MLRGGVGQSQERETRQAVEAAGTQALARAGIARADFAMVFFTADHAAQSSALISALSKTVGTDCVVGSSGAGVLTDEGEIEGSAGVAVFVGASGTPLSRPAIFDPFIGNEATYRVDVVSCLVHETDE